MTDTTGIAVRSGWVRTTLRGRVRQMYVALEDSAICFRRAPTTPIKKRLPLSQITRIRLTDPSRLELKIKTGELSLQIDPPEDCLAWIDSIMASLQTAYEADTIAEIKDFREFVRRANDVLYTREATLQAENEAVSTRLKNQVTDLIAALSLEEARIVPLLTTDYPLTHTAFQLLSTAAGSASAALPACDDLETAKVKVTVNRGAAGATVQKAVSVRFIDPEEEVVRRSDTTRALKWKYSGVHFDAISFCVDKSVRLTAISVCTPIHPSASTVIEDLRILNGSTSHAPDRYSHASPVTLVHQSESTQRVQLRYPVHVEQGEFYTVLMRIKGKNTYKCVNCRGTCVGETGVHWTFRSTTFVNPHLSNKSDVSSGPIAALFYRPSS